MAHAIVDLATEVLGSDILLLDVSSITVIADYFVIVSGDSDRQIQAISDRVVEQMKEKYDERPLSIEGLPASGWLLVDFGSVIVHVFTPQQREHYRLEEFWSSARTVVRIA
jgi:ribosome-associated protein